MNKYNIAIYIGRFQGLHHGQVQNMKHALTIADKLIILIGSSNKPIDWKNPWTAEERAEMIKASFSKEDLTRIHIQYIEDRLYQDSEWEALVFEAVDSILLQYSKYRLNAPDEKHRAKIALVGCDKDDSTWYLHRFPNWKQEFLTTFCHDGTDKPLNSTGIRVSIYDYLMGNHDSYLNQIKKQMPQGAYEFVVNWMKTPAAKYVLDWYNNDRLYQKPYESLPYGTNFYCADNVVVQSGYVLLVKRKFHPGLGLWALPGGHVGKNENATNGAIRELYEETSIKVPEKIIRSSLIGEKLFDHPERSLRGRCGDIVGRTVSISHCYALNGGDGLPRVKAADDAEEAWWFNFAEVKKMKSELFEDHGAQIEYWISRL